MLKYATSMFMPTQDVTTSVRKNILLIKFHSPNYWVAENGIKWQTLEEACRAEIVLFSCFRWHLKQSTLEVCRILSRGIFSALHPSPMQLRVAFEAAF
jgi:hypothetical protein